MHLLLEQLVWEYQCKFLVAYSAMNSICYFILIVVAIKIKIGRVKIPHGQFLIKSILFSMIVNTIDTFWKWIEVGPYSVTKSSAMLMNTAYFIALHLMYLYLFLYFYSEVIIRPLQNKRLFFISIPSLIMILVNIINMKYNFLFYISDDLIYTRSDLYMLEYVIPYIYLCVPYIKAFNIVYKSRREGVPYKKLNRDVLIVPMVIGTSGTIGMFFTTIPLLSIALSLTITFTYMDLLEDFVTIDPISALPNRPEFITELKHRIEIENLKKRDDLYIIIVDILKLRLINDKYGYNEGDNIIRRVSNILRRQTSLSTKMHMFACRYNGDQYFLIVNTTNTEDIMNFCTSLQIKINQSNVINQTMYNVDVMYGFSKYQEGISIGEFIDDAEKNLDINKIKFSRLRDITRNDLKKKET